MATVYADAAGEILRFLESEAMERQYPDPPPGTAFTVAFDEDTNEALCADMGTSTDPYDAPGGVLRRNGQAVTIAPPSAEYTDHQQLMTYWQNLQAYLGLNNPTNAQSVAAIKTIIRVLRLFYRVLRRSGQMAGPGK